MLKRVFEVACVALSLIGIGIAGCSSETGKSAGGSRTPNASGAPHSDEQAASSPWELLSPDFGEGRNVVALAEGPRGSVLVTTSPFTWMIQESPDELTVHRVDADGTVRWSHPTPAIGTAARLDDGHVVIASSDRRALQVVDAESGAVAQGPKLEHELVFLAAISGGGVTGVLEDGNEGGVGLFRWTAPDASLTITPIVSDESVNIVPERWMPLIDELGTVWFTVGWDLLRLAPDGTTKKIAGSYAGYGPRKGGGIFARGGDDDPARWSSLFEIDADGSVVATAPLPEAAAAAVDGRVYFEGASGALVASGLFQPDEAEASGERELRLVSIDDADVRRTYGVSDRAQLHAATTAVDGLWLGGEYRGHIRIGETELRSGHESYGRPLLLRVAKLESLPTERGVSRCAADSSACLACKKATPSYDDACESNGCAGHNLASDCACHAPEDFHGCVAHDSDALALEPVYTECAKACGILLTR
jgi:hypothetical protein